MRAVREASRRLSVRGRAGTAVFFALFYLYIVLRVDPRLLYHRQGPVYSLTFEFLEPFLARPGGPVEYVSALLGQFCRYAWAGGLVVTAVAWLIVVAAGGFIAAVSGARPGGLRFVPGVLLLMLHQQYGYPLCASVALLVALAGAWLYASVCARLGALRAVLFVVLSALVHYAAGGPYMLFALLCALFELTRRRWAAGAAYALCAAGVPYVADRWFFVQGLAHAYRRLLPFRYDPGSVPIVSAALVASVPVAAAWAVVRRRAARAAKPPGAWVWAALWLAAVVAVLATFDRDEKLRVRMSLCAHNRNWHQVLELARRLRVCTTFARHDINRALYHTGRLADEMFGWPQRRDEPGLVRPSAGGFATPSLLRYCDLYFELGRINDSERMAHEALEIGGDQPRLLHRLGLINVLKGRPRAAGSLFGALRWQLFTGGLAERCLRRLEADPLMASDEDIARARPLMIVEDRRLQPDVETILQQPLQANGRNRMAFEYLMAHYLLTGQLGKIVRNIGRLNDFDYVGIPRHYEEALALYGRATGRPPPLYGRQISGQTATRLERFFERLDGHGGDMDAARRALARDYGDTFWFYHTFGESASCPPFTGRLPMTGPTR